MPRWHQSRLAPCGLSAWQAASTPSCCVAGGPWSPGDRNTSAPGIFPGSASVLYVTTRPTRYTVSTARLAGTPTHTFWYNTDLSGTCTASGEAASSSGGRACQWPESARYRGSLSPAHRKRWPVARLCEWYRPEAAPLTARRRPTLAFLLLLSPAWKRLGCTVQLRMQKAEKTLLQSRRRILVAHCA